MGPQANDQPNWRIRVSRPDAPAVPIYVAGMRRTFWVPPRYRLIAVKTLDGRRFTMRALARSLGYSLTGLRHALLRMAGWGLFRMTTTRGRSGSTRLLWALDVSSPQVARPNVPTTVTVEESPHALAVAGEGTFDDQRPREWHELGATLRALALPSRA